MANNAIQHDKLLPSGHHTG